MYTLTAGAIAGAVEAIVTYPTEFVKTQLQLQDGGAGSARNGGVVSFFFFFWGGGFGGFWLIVLLKLTHRVCSPACFLSNIILANIQRRKKRHSWE